MSTEESHRFLKLYAGASSAVSLTSYLISPTLVHWAVWPRCHLGLQSNNFLNNYILVHSGGKVATSAVSSVNRYILDPEPNWFIT